MTKWLHNRKGVIEGEITLVHDEWVEIRLSGDQRLRTAKGWEDHKDGEIVTVRKSFIKEMVA